MLAKDYNNEFLRQIRMCAETTHVLADGVTFDYLAQCVPAEEIKKTREVFLTGCGDSYCACVAAKPVYENIESDTSTGMNPGIPTEAFRCIEFTRYYDTYRRFWLSGFGRRVPLVCGVSISGSTIRPTEALARGNHYGAVTVAFTDHADSILAKEAKYTVLLHSPATVHAPCVTTYQASTFALMNFALYGSAVRGRMAMDEAVRQRDALLRYSDQFSGSFLNEIEERTYELSQKWIAAGVDYMDFVGDSADFATAFFGSAKMVESFGGVTTNDDSEGWNHINYFIRNPETIGTFVIANSSSPSYSRARETIETACALHRPVVVISDLGKDAFPDSCEVFTLPKPEYKWINPYLQHIPMDYVAAFTGLIQNIPDFRQDSELHKRDKGAARFLNSKIKIVGGDSRDYIFRKDFD